MGKRNRKTEHAGAKNGGGYYGKRVDAKRISDKLRRRADRETAAAVDAFVEHGDRAAMENHLRDALHSAVAAALVDELAEDPPC